MPLVVSTTVSGVVFARFCTVEPISRKSAFHLWRHSWSKKFKSRRKVHFLCLGLLFSSHSFPKITFFGNNTIWVDPATHTVISKSKNSFEKCVCWRRRHNVLERKWSKSGTFSLIFLFKSLWHHKESFIWLEYARLYGNEQKEHRMTTPLH